MTVSATRRLTKTRPLPLCGAATGGWTGTVEGKHAFRWPSFTRLSTASNAGTAEVRNSVGRDQVIIPLVTTSTIRCLTNTSRYLCVSPAGSGQPGRSRAALRTTRVLFAISSRINKSTKYPALATPPRPKDHPQPCCTCRVALSKVEQDA